MITSAWSLTNKIMRKDLLLNSGVRKSQNRECKKCQELTKKKQGVGGGMLKEDWGKVGQSLERWNSAWVLRFKKGPGNWIHDLQGRDVKDEETSDKKKTNVTYRDTLGLEDQQWFLWTVFQLYSLSGRKKKGQKEEVVFSNWVGERKRRKSRKFM